MEKKLYKSRTNVKIDGVCAGFAKYFGIDVTLVRLIWIALTFTSIGFWAYIICALVVPREPKETLEAEPVKDYRNYPENGN